MRSDLADPRTILDIDDVRALRPGEALAMETGGTISAAVTFSWADAITSRLADLLDGLPHDRPIALKLKSGIEATASVRVKDRFSIIMSRTADGRYRIAVKKVKSHDHAFEVDVSLGATADAIPAIDKALAPLFESITGVALDAAERIAEKIGIGDLTTEEDEIVEKIAKRLGIRDEEKRAELVRDAVAALRKKLLNRLASVARWKAATSFSYEYARIDENSAIADYILNDDELLEHDHALAIDGDLARIAALLREETSHRTLVKYLNDSTLTRRSALGFSLGIGKWIALEAREESVFRQSTRTSLDGLHLVTTRGTRRYEEKGIAENDFEWVVDLKAQMREFAATPVTDAFDYGLQYLVTLERRSLDDGDLERMLDFAAMWDVAPPAAAAFAEALGRPATIRLQLLLDRTELAKTLACFPDQVDRSWARPLAAAMPYMSSFPERRSFSLRREVYADAWEVWLGGEQLSSAEWVSLIEPRLRSGIIMLEERRLPASFVWTSGEGHAGLRDALASFVRGARALADAITTPQPPAAIADAYALLQPFWTNRLYIAASGRYLLDRARDAGIRATTSLQVEFDDEVIVA